jgi:hypothetical protein
MGGRILIKPQIRKKMHDNAGTGRIFILEKNISLRTEEKTNRDAGDEGDGRITLFIPSIPFIPVK